MGLALLSPEESGERDSSLQRMGNEESSFFGISTSDLVFFSIVNVFGAGGFVAFTFSFARLCKEQRVNRKGSVDTRPLPTDFETTPRTRAKVEDRVEGRKSKETDLYASRCHIQLCGQLCTQGSIWLCIAFEDGFEDFELSAGCAFPVFDFVRGIRIKSAKINSRWIEVVWGGISVWHGVVKDKIRGLLLDGERKRVCIWKGLAGKHVKYTSKSHEQNMEEKAKRTVRSFLVYSGSLVWLSSVHTPTESNELPPSEQETRPRIETKIAVKKSILHIYTIQCPKSAEFLVLGPEIHGILVLYGWSAQYFF